MGAGCGDQGEGGGSEEAGCLHGRSFGFGVEVGDIRLAVSLACAMQFPTESPRENTEKRDTAFP
jgi:hypothetical protein